MEIPAKHAVESFSVCVAVLSLILPIAACGSQSSTSGITTPSPIPQGPFTLSGQVFDVTSGRRVPAVGFSVLAAVASFADNCPPGLCESLGRWTYESATTGLDGRYSFPQLPAGAVIISARSETHLQLCGAGALLNTTTQLDLEITSRANPQPSPTLPPLRVTGQIYETTPVGRVGLADAVIYMQALAGDTLFLLEVRPDKNGRYTACGLPAHWPIAFWTGATGYLDTFVWHRFGTDGTLDIELKRQ
jgi:hypothetical protein